MAYTILIIVNEPMLTDLLSEHLTHHGYRTHTANNSAQALELLRDQPDLIVLDLALPSQVRQTAFRPIRTPISPSPFGSAN